MAGVGALTLLIGTGTAWLVTMYRFPGRGLFQWLLLLPLAMPTYIIAYCFLELFDYSGALQSGLRQIFGWHSAKDYWFPDIRSVGGAIFVMSMVLYPYVYITARASFLAQSVCVLEVSRTLGRSAAGDLLGSGAAAGEAGACRRRGAHPDGDAERHRRGRILRRAHPHRRRLRHLARPQQPCRRGADCLHHARLRLRGARDRADAAGEPPLPPHDRALPALARGDARRRIRHLRGSCLRASRADRFRAAGVGAGE